MKRLNYIDGLKGWCAVSVCILHVQLMFVINGYIGWKCLPEAVLNPFDGYSCAQLTKDVRGKKCLMQKIKDIFAKKK